MLYICIICAYSHSRSQANWKLRASHTWWAVLAQACVSWPIRADWVFRRRTLKRREQKQTDQQSAATVYSVRKLLCFCWALTHQIISRFRAEDIFNVVSDFCSLLACTTTWRESSGTCLPSGPGWSRGLCCILVHTVCPTKQLTLHPHAIAIFPTVQT